MEPLAPNGQRCPVRGNWPTFAQRRRTLSINNLTSPWLDHEVGENNRATIGPINTDEFCSMPSYSGAAASERAVELPI